MEGEREIAASGLTASHPELHHYTDFNGLRGIIDSNTLWATHFSHLNDSSEVMLLREPIINALLASPGFVSGISRHWNRRLQRVRARSHYIEVEVRKFIEAAFDAAFQKTNITEPLAETYIFSFCAHSPTQSYEAQNGLLSQWRAYGGNERYCIVFDTTKMINLLEQEFTHNAYVYLRLAEVSYASDSADAGPLFPELLASWANHIADRFNGTFQDVSFDMIIHLLSAATRFKHQGFKEENEVRIIAIPHSRPMVDKLIARYPEGVTRSAKLIHSRMRCTRNVPHVALFDSFASRLPIRRVIIGPSIHQQDNFGRYYTSQTQPHDIGYRRIANARHFLGLGAGAGFALAIRPSFASNRSLSSSHSSWRAVSMNRPA